VSARAAARRRRARNRSKGVSCRVNARRARRHLRRLAAGKLGHPLCPERAARLAGISPREVERLLKGRGRESVRSIPRETEYRILAVTPQTRPIPARPSASSAVTVGRVMSLPSTP
jgi:AraC-like DNA-binding protein